MPRAAANFKHKKSAQSVSLILIYRKITTMTHVDFTSVGNGKWLCNICKADVMTTKQAATHERSAQHSSRAEANGLDAAQSAMENPTDEILSSLRKAERERNHWTDLSPNLVSFWRRGL